MLDPQPPSQSGNAGSSLVRSRVIAGLIVVFGLVVGFTFWLRPDPQGVGPAPQPDDEDDFDRVTAAVNPGYVGIQSCAECHAKRVASFQTTRHFVACTLASGVTAPGFAPGRGRCDTRFSEVRFEMTRSGNDCIATVIESTPKGEKRVDYPISFVYGSANKRDEMYFAWQDDRIVHLPVAWLFPQDRWAADVQNTRVLDTHPSCLECHNTWIASTPGSPIRYRKEDMHLGVTCERCHGPGRDHSEYHRKNPKADAHAILHPRTLSRERLIDLCAQCHGNTRMISNPFSYRPGQPLETAYRTAKAKYREDDTTTNQVQYLSESNCFQKSKMTCISCHDPHSNKSSHTGCIDCHTPASCKDQPKQPVAVRNDCVGCHMPQHTWMNSHFYTTSDDHYLPVAPRSEHRIGVYPWAKQAVILAWLRKQPDAESRTKAERTANELNAYWLKEAEQFHRNGRLKASIGAYREALQVSPNPQIREKLKEVVARQTELDDLLAKLDAGRRRNPDEAIPILKKILELKPEDARSHSELGTLYSMTGRRAEAITHLEKVIHCDPSDCSGMIRLAWMANVEGRPQEGIALCAQAERIEPGHPTNQFVWGMIHAQQTQWSEAEAHFRNSLKRNPTDVGANQALSDALRHQGQTAEALRFARSAVRESESKDPEVLMTLADCYLAAKRTQDARKTFQQALVIADATNPQLALVIRQRLRQFP